jgi:hypothetical protein
VAGPSGRPEDAISASVTRGESRRQATHRSADSVLIAHTSPGAFRAGPESHPRAQTGPPRPLRPPYTSDGLPSGVGWRRALMVRRAGTSATASSVLSPATRVVVPQPI